MTPTSDKAMQRTALVVSSLASFMTPFMGQAINIALPTIGRQFAMDAIRLNWVVTAYALAAAMFLIPCSRIADIVGRKKVFTVGIVVQTLGSLLCGFSQNGLWLISCRVIQGFGGAMLFGTGIAVLTSVFPPERRGWALGVNSAAVYLGLSLGPPIGGFLTQYLSWRAVFFVHMPIGAAALALIWWKLEGEWTEAKGERFDWVGAVLFGLAMASLMLGFPSFGKGASKALGSSLVGAGVAGLCLFVFWETRQRHPMLEVRLFVSRRVYGFSNLAALIHYSATASLGFLLSFYLQ
ncbi:MAG: MFS transporter, partial [Candidatus Sumerlaeota bacterium]|nr:MFS transporter [Candidatus Sumerlaeota bacterium]